MMPIIVDLTPEQIDSIKDEYAKLKDMADNNSPGMLIAPVFGNQMRVGVISNDKARSVQRVLWAEKEGATCSTAYDGHNAEVSGAGTASAGLPGYAGDNNGERKCENCT